MDFDSSSKFISSLAKFLQSLCNGYVEFNNGVEVIGHIYINVDTGKKIDYVLNEKVCKTDENSVTFISNSFHAQPAEKPKPPEKPPKVADSEITHESPTQDEIVIMDEPESDNIGTLPPHQQHKPRPTKRSHHQSFPSNHRQQSKFSRTDQLFGHNGSPQTQGMKALHTDNNSSLHGAKLSVNSELSTSSDVSHLPNVYPQSYSDPSNSQLGTEEERDIKPHIDSDSGAVRVKQEYDPSQQAGQEDQEGYDDSQGQGAAFPGMPYDQYYGDGSQGGQDYSHSQAEYYQGEAGMPVEGKPGDSTGTWGCPPILHSKRQIWEPWRGCPVSGCQAKFFRNKSDFRTHWLERHEEITAYHYCAVCENVAFKRKSNLLQHIRSKHRGDHFRSCLGKIEHQSNLVYIDPSPLTLASVLGEHTALQY